MITKDDLKQAIDNRSQAPQLSYEANELMHQKLADEMDKWEAAGGRIKKMKMGETGLNKPYNGTSHLRDNR